MDDESERFAKMANQKRRSVSRRGAVWGLTRGRGRPVPLSSGVERAVPRLSQALACMAQPNLTRSVSAKAHDFRKRSLQSRSDKSCQAQLGMAASHKLMQTSNTPQTDKTPTKQATKKLSCKQLSFSINPQRETYLVSRKWNTWQLVPKAGAWAKLVPSAKPQLDRSSTCLV